ncbi:MAG: TetR/AcrR family transcriptional regulator [Chloroflexota bacterium]
MTQAEPSRREQILQVASRIFREKTYHGTSLQDIADAVGMQKGSLYYYFNSKEDLLGSIVTEALAVIDRRLADIASRQMSPPDRLREIIRSHIRFNHEYQEATTLFLAERNVISALWREEMVESRKRRDGLLHRTLKEGIREGIYRCEDLQLTVRAIVGMLNASAFWYELSGPHSPEEIADYFYRLLHYGLAVRPHPPG